MERQNLLRTYGNKKNNFFTLLVIKLKNNLHKKTINTKLKNFGGARF